MATKPKSKRVRLGDTVSTPIVRPTRGLSLLPGPDGWTSADLEVVEAKAVKMFELLEVYGVSRSTPDHWFQLAYCLANDYVRGFRVIDEKQRIPGRPRKDKAPLSTPAVAARVAQGTPVRKACHEIGIETGENPGTIETRYYNDLRENPTAKEPKRRSRGGARP